ncbi:hypothetical protein JXA85_07695 [Candidatus Woesearchaeota archaeon]|nr:hypothetical protein [Candidatus Woesearchaeota archaeon]
MQVYHDVVTTEVDSLIDLVKKKKRISFEDAAAALRLPQKTIESWAAFLEEEGELAIDYKFTTPFLVDVSDKNKAANEGKQGSEYIQPNKRISNIESFLKQVQGEILKGEFDEAYKALNSFHSESKSLFEDLKFERGEEKPFEDKHLQDTIEAISNFLKNAFLHIQKSENEKASEKLKKAIQPASSVLNELKSMYFDMKKKRTVGTEDEIPVSQDAKRVDDDLLGIKQPDILVREIYSRMEMGDFIVAKKLYSRLQEIYSRLPQDFMEKKNLLKQDMVKLNRDLALELRQDSNLKVKDARKRIDELTKLIASELKHGNMNSAAALINKMDKIVSNLPDGYLEEKAKMRAEIDLIEQKYLKMKAELAASNVDRIEAEIGKLLSKFKKQIADKDVAGAESAYKQAKAMFKQFPQGFIDKEVKIQNILLDSYRTFLELKEKLSTEQTSTVVAAVDLLIKNANEAVDLRKNLEEASKLYSRITAEYKKIPKGFLAERTRIETEILELNKKIMSVKKDHTQGEYHSKTEHIKSMLKKAETYIKNNQIDLANELFLEISVLFNQLPTGFLHHKTELHNQILNMYRDILVSSDIKFTAHLDTDTRKKYDDLLKMIVSFHMHLDLMELSLLEPNYEYIVRLYDELPHGFISKNVKIRTEINKLSDIMKLYKLDIKLDESTRKNDHDSFSRTLPQMRILLEKTIKESPEAVKFIEEIKGRVQRSSEMGMGNLTEPGKPAAIEKRLVEQKIIEERESIDDLRHVPAVEEHPNIHLDNLIELLKNKDFTTALSKMDELISSDKITDYQRKKLIEFRDKLHKIEQDFMETDMKNEMLPLKEEVKRHLKQRDFDSALKTLEKIRGLSPSHDVDVLIKRVSNLKENIVYAK